MNHERRNHLLSIIANAAKALREWIEHGDSTLVPEDELFRRFQEIADQAMQVIRPRADELDTLFVNFAPHWQAFAWQQRADPTILPSPELWQAWEALSGFQMLSTMPTLKRIETIAEFKEQKVTDRQICLNYGFVREDGSADYDILQEEISEPGKHTGPGTGWVAPVNRYIATKIAQAKADLDAINRRRAAKVTAVAAAIAPAPESIEQLIVEGISAAQISRMKKISTDQVYEYCREHGLPPPPYDYTSHLRAPGLHDPEIPEARRKAMDQLGPDQSQQFKPIRHPMAEGPYDYRVSNAPPMTEGPNVGRVGDGDADEPADDMPSNIDLSELSPEEANQIREAFTYFHQGMEIGDIASAMGIHGNKVRSLLTKAGSDLRRPTSAAS